MSTKYKLKTLDFFAENPVFSLDEAATKLDAPRGRIGIVERLKYYLKTGRLKLITRAIYAVVPYGSLAPGFQPDPFLVAAAIRPDAIFSYHSALELLGSAHSIWNQCTLFSARRRPPLVLEHSSIHFLRDPDSLEKDLRNLGTRKAERRGRLLVITGPERTLIECLRRPALCGGAEELLQSAGGFSILDLDMLDSILRTYDNACLWAAAGWFLERFRQTFHVPDSLLTEMEKHRPKSPQYLERGRRGGILARRWNMILPESIAKGNANDEP
jgi:predicted transcriptional regulator of viral defense system